MRNWKLGALVLAAFAGGAQAQVFDNCVDATTPVGEGTYAFDLGTATNDAAGTCGATQTAQDLWINYRPTQSANAIVTTCGFSFFDTVLAAYDACGGTPIICVDDSCGLQTTITFPVTAGTSYFIRIADFAGGTGAGEVNITLDTAPTNPTGRGAATPARAGVGASSLITVAVTPGTNPVSSDLRVTADFSQINAGGTSDSLFDDGTNGDEFAGDLTFSRSITVGNAATPGDYTIAFSVSDAEMRSSSGNIAFTVTPPPPTNDNCANAQAVGEGSFAVSLGGATSDGTASCTGATEDAWFLYTPTASGVSLINTCDSASLAAVAAFDACGGSEIACGSFDCNNGGQIALSVTTGNPVWIRVGALGTPGDATLTIGTPQPGPANDNCADATDVTSSGTFDFDNTAASADGTATCGASAGGPDVWFRVTPANSGDLIVSTCGLTSMDTVLAAFDACGGTQLVCLDDSCGLQTQITVGVTANTPVWIRVAGFAGNIGSGQISFELPGVPPPGRWTEDGDAGDLPDTAQVPSGSGDLTGIRGNLDPSDADMFRIRICDYANFSATTVGGATFDTQLFLFNTDGMGVSFNDDAGTLQSRITAQFLSADGDYLIALSGYNHDAVDSAGAIIWANTPFGTERQPDGPGAANPIAGWIGTGGDGPYTIALTGACFPGGSRCVADIDDGTFSGTPDGGVTIDDLLYYLVIYGDGNIAADVDNGTFTGTQDGGVTIDDLLYFLFRYGEGC